MFKTQHFLMFVLAAHVCSRFASGDDNVGSGSNSDSSGDETIEKIITTSHVDASTARASTSATFAPKATGTAPPASASATKVPAAGAGAGASAAATLKVSTGPMQSATTTAAADSDNAPPAPPGYGDGCHSTASTILYSWIGVAVAVVWGLCSTVAACIYCRRSATFELQLDLMRRSRQRQNKHRHAASGSLPSLAKDADALPLSTAAKDSDPKNQPQHPSFPASCLKPQHAANSSQAPAPSCAKPQQQQQQQQQQQPSRSAWHSKLDETPRYVDLEEISIDGVRATMASASATMASMLLHDDDDRNGSSMGRNDTVASSGQSPSNSSSTLSSSGDKKGSRAALLRPQLRRCKYVQDAAAGGQRCKLNAASGTPHGYCVKHTCPTPGCPNSKKSLEALCETCTLEDAASTAEIVYEEPCHQALLIYDAANAARSPPATAVESPLAAATPASAEPSEMLNAYPLLGIMMHAGVDGESSTDDAHAGTNGLQNNSSSSSSSSGGGGELEEMEF